MMRLYRLPQGEFWRRKTKELKTMKTLMNTIYPKFALFAFAWFAFSPGLPAATPIDTTLYTRYHTDPAQTIVDWNVCGSLPGSSGCYGSGTLGPFGKVGALMEGEPKTDRRANTVTRAIYVLEIASGPNQNEVVLYVYTKVDTITTDTDTVTITLSQTISLPLVGGISNGPNQTSMAANKQFLFIGTSQSPVAVEVNKRTFSVTQFSAGSPPINISSITANDYGYATLSFGSFNTSDTAFIVVGPDGSTVEDGDGSQFVLNTDQAIKVTAAHAGIQRPAHGGIPDLPRVRPFRSPHDQEERVLAAPAAAPIDGTLYTRYNVDPDHTNIGWNVCGSLPGSTGCYGSGSLGPFGKVGAMLEGEPKTDRHANTVTRAIYVLDPASGPNQNEVVLYVYTKVDTITTDSDTVTVTLSQTISLPLVGDPLSSGALPFMAANTQFLFLGTDQSPQAVELDKRTFSITQLGGFTPPINVFAILANQYGYATLSFGNFRGGGNKAFIVAGPDGSDEEEGDETQFMLDTVMGLLLRP
ncbi:MAG: hypothetical protein DME51_03855 [Verrucomicrobia bacterium]|nr:MAG: hypothetical protein DME51_03855 [Verrucomicrobiota bacterium]